MTVSREARSIIAYLEATRLPHRITSVVRYPPKGQRPRSYHEQKGTDGLGLAVDFAGVAPGVSATTSEQMLEIYRAFLVIAHQLAELIYSGPGVTVAVKNGRRVDGAAVYGPLVWPDHRDHVHVAVPRGIFLSHPARTMEEHAMPDDPNVPNIDGPVKIEFFRDPATGRCIGYYIYSDDTGEIHGFGPGAPYHGRSEVVET